MNVSGFITVITI